MSPVFCFCASLTPNPSIKRTNNGVALLFAFACTVPPLFAAYLKLQGLPHLCQTEFHRG
jgi:hypothetical protein